VADRRVAARRGGGRPGRDDATDLPGFIDRWILPALGPTRLDRLTPGDVRDLCDKMRAAGLSASSIRQVRAILSGSLAYAVEHEWTRRNVAREVRPPTEGRYELRVSSPEDLRALLEASTEIDDHLGMATAIVLAALTGAHLGELCGLRWSDLEGVTLAAGGVLRIERSAYVLPTKLPALKDKKTHSERGLAIDPFVAAMLDRRDRTQRAFAGDVGVELLDDPYLLSRKSDGSGP
jgi:integrase